MSGGHFDPLTRDYLLVCVRKLSPSDVLSKLSKYLSSTLQLRIFFPILSLNFYMNVCVNTDQQKKYGCWVCLRSILFNLPTSFSSIFCDRNNNYLFRSYLPGRAHFERTCRCTCYINSGLMSGAVDILKGV